VRTAAPEVGLVVVGADPPTEAMKQALESNASSFVPRGQLDTLLPIALRQCC
jgi:hypothetical protein